MIDREERKTIGATNRIPVRWAIARVAARLRAGGNDAEGRLVPRRDGARLRVAPGVRDLWSRFLIARLTWILLMTIFVTASAGAFLVLQKPLYRSQATVAVYPASGVSSAVQPFVMGTEKGVASSGAVLSLASQSLLIPVGKLQSGMSITIPVDSDLLVISYSDPNPQVAQSVAEAIAQAYVAYRTTPLGATNVKSGTSSTATLQAAVVTDATLPTTPDNLNPLLTIGIALIIGLALGIGLALVLDWLDDSLRGPIDLHVQSAAPVLAEIPAFDRKRHRMADGLVIVKHPDSAVAGAYRNLRTRVMQAAQLRHAKTLLVTSPSREDRTTVAANLAASVAQAGRSVVLVCADLDAGNVHVLFGLPRELGVTSVVGAEAALADALATTGVHGLKVLTSGPSTLDPSSFLQSRTFSALLTRLRASADLVVIDAPPVLAGADAAALAEEAGMVLLVADARTSSRAEVRAATQELHRVRDRVIGCVLDNVGHAGRLGSPVQRAATSDALPIAPAHVDEPDEAPAPAAIAEEPHAENGAADATAAVLIVEAVALDAELAGMPASNGAPHHTPDKTKRRRHQGRNEL